MTALKPDALTLLKDMIKMSMIEDAVDTEVGHCATFAPRLVDTAPFSYSRQDTDVVCRFRNHAQFTKATGLFL